eukprot:284620-Chlamydomonas_euryale.AAC.1
MEPSASGPWPPRLRMQHQTAAPQRTATPWTQATQHARKQRKPVVRRGQTQKKLLCVCLGRGAAAAATAP